MYDTLWPNGYNQCPANSLDKSAIEKMKRTKKEKFAAMSAEERREYVDKMVQANTGAKRSEETKKKMSESAKKYLSKNPRVMSEDTKRKIAESVSKRRKEKFWSTKKGGE